VSDARLWSIEELEERWTLGAEDLAWLSGLPDAGKLGLAAQLMYWRRNGRFPDEEADLAPAVVRHLVENAPFVIAFRYADTKRTKRP